LREIRSSLRREKGELETFPHTPVHPTPYLPPPHTRIFTHADGSIVCCVFYGCVSVCFPHDVSKKDAARITKLDTQMLHDESWEPVHFGIKRSEVKVTTSVSVFRQNAILPLLRT